MEDTDMKLVTCFWQEEVGQDMVEYALLLGFVALAAVTIYQGVAGQVKGLWTTTNTVIANANTAAT
jgi:Flp pilus assembly pilin Flp